MLLRNLLLGGVACAVLAAGSLPAQQETFHVEPSRSQVHFTLSDPIHTVNGTFKVEQGSIAFNLVDGSITGEVVVDAASGSSGDSTRDNKMKKNQMMASKFTTVTFAPRHFSGTLQPSGDSKVTVAGTFVLLGKPHEISVVMHIHRDGQALTAAGSFVVPYIEWGMKDPSVFLLHVSKEVNIDLSLAGTLAP